ncbi:uncharacterized protein Z518_01031 [Rhinocladiella mackenziei CBS 650.93]|uniref:Uncharacterized protein n=1 Tax=Rhinocladiella mackenziei CBS 650.93 TaxID=1442369 RepID=A0A0D2JKE8_9EURO|nr:uncharacterized protein Z518_01031 [Rhinocladiella mackenziei CBS 650.93]KIX09950.1 hypothetical protein Z518_01031 [Rhinocladiella mackenziei CBS 650.93]
MYLTHSQAQKRSNPANSSLMAVGSFSSTYQTSTTLIAQTPTLSAMYKNKLKLAGIVYMQPESKTRE